MHVRSCESQVRSGDPIAGAWPGVRIHPRVLRAEIAHAVIENASGDHGALWLGASEVALTDTQIRNAKGTGVVAERDTRFTRMADNVFDHAGKVALSLHAPAVGDLGANRFDAGAVVLVHGGTIAQPATWRNLGVPYVIEVDVDINGADNATATLEIAAGSELRFRDVQLSLGGYGNSKLVAAGTADAPVVLTSDDDKAAGAWKGIAVHRRGKVRLAHVKLSYTGGKAGVVVDDDAVVDVSSVSCAGCAGAVIASTCAARLTTADIVAEAGTPVGEAKPACN